MDETMTTEARRGATKLLFTKLNSIASTLSINPKVVQDVYHIELPGIMARQAKSFASMMLHADYVAGLVVPDSETRWREGVAAIAITSGAVAAGLALKGKVHGRLATGVAASAIGAAGAAMIWLAREGQIRAPERRTRSAERIITSKYQAF
jgi:hypothetical protein